MQPALEKEPDTMNLHIHLLAKRLDYKITEQGKYKATVGRLLF